MLGSWFKRRAQLNSVRDATADLARFVSSLKGHSADELGMLVAIAAVIRMNVRQEGRLPDEALGVGAHLFDDQQDAIHANMSRLVREWQTMDQPTDAAGGTVWLHFLRAYRYPEVRLLGGQMWANCKGVFQLSLRLSRSSPWDAAAPPNFKKLGWVNGFLVRAPGYWFVVKIAWVLDVERTSRMLA